MALLLAFIHIDPENNTAFKHVHFKSSVKVQLSCLANGNILHCNHNFVNLYVQSELFAP